MDCSFEDVSASLCLLKVHRQNVTHKLKIAREKGLFTDVTFIVGVEGFTKILRAHRVILACGSPVFEAMLYRPLDGRLEDLRIRIPDIQPEAFKNLLDYLYGAGASFTTILTELETYKAADKYLVPGLKKVSENNMCCAIKNETVLRVLKVAESTDMFTLKQRCLEFVETNAESIMSSDEITTVSEGILESILSMQNLQMSEIQLLHAVACWEMLNPRVSTNSKRFISFVRFTGMKLEDFCDFTDKYPSIIADCDALAIVKFLLCSSKHKLPDWCSKAAPRKATNAAVNICKEPSRVVTNRPSQVSRERSTALSRGRHGVN